MELVGKVLGKYRIVGLTGSGGTADVYKGLQVGLEREVAIRVLPPAHAMDPDRLASFRSESQAMARLSHPNIITVYDSGEQDGYVYYVTEYLTAESLETVITTQGKLPLKQALTIARDILKALVYIHDKGITHRNLTSSSIRFDLRGNPIVTDFGPAHNLGEDVDERSDLYQLGMVLFQMLTGTQAPPVTPPSRLNPEVPDSLDELLLKVLERQKDARFTSAGEMLQALTKVERKVEARQANMRTDSSTSTASTAAAPTISSTIGELGALPSTGGGTYHWVMGLLAGPTYEEQTRAELISNVSMVLVPALLTVVLLILYVTGSLFPRPPLKLLEQAIEPESRRAVIAWKANAPCYSYIEYYTSLDSRQRTAIPAVQGTEFREELGTLEPDTTYYLQFVFTPDPDDPEGCTLSKELEFTTKPQITIRGILAEPSDTEVRISWSTNLETDTKVRLGVSTDYSREQENPGQLRERDHLVPVSGLDPETDYHFVIVATDPDQGGRPMLSEDRTFRTLKPGEKRGVIGAGASSDSPLVELTKSYMDKLSRMTPDERQKLRHSLDTYLDLDSDAKPTVEVKTGVLASPTDEGSFEDRLRLFLVWSRHLGSAGIEHGYAPEEDAKLRTLHGVNPRKSFRRLDDCLAHLGSLDPALGN